MSTEIQVKAAPIDEPVQRFDLRMFRDTLRRRKWIALGVLTVVVAIGAAQAMTAEKFYRSAATIVIDADKVSVLEGVREVVDAVENREYYQTQYRVIQSVPMAETTLRLLGVSLEETREHIDTLGPFTEKDERTIADLEQKSRRSLMILGFRKQDLLRTLPSRLKKFDAPAAFSKSIVVTPVANSRVVLIAFENRSPTIAAEVANGVADAYIEYNLEKKMEATNSAVEWLKNESRELEAKLKDSENAILNFRKENGIFAAAVGDHQNMLSTSIARLHEQLQGIRARRIEVENRYRMTKRDLENGVGAAENPSLLSNPLMGQLRSQELGLEQEQIGLSLKYNDDHPRLASINERLAAVRKEMHKEVLLHVARLKEEYESALQHEETVAASIAEATNQGINWGSKEAEFNTLVRARDKNRELYLMVFKREKEAELTGRLRINNVSKLEIAQPVMKPVRPNTPATLLVVLALGLGCAIGSAFFVDRLDDSIKNEHQLDQLGLYFLGAVPEIQDKITKLEGPQDRDRWTLSHPRSVIAECFRAIRTNLLFFSPDKQPRLFLVVSSDPQEGKSTTALNLAATFAQSGGKVLLIDTDMRNPRLHKSFGLDVPVGLSSLVLGQCSIEEAVHPTGIENLDLLPCGVIPPNPGELVLAEKFKQTIELLASRYDRIFLDSPPVRLVSDALVMGSMVDGIIFVVRARKTSLMHAAACKKRLEDVGARIFGAVLNNAGADLAGSSYYPYAYYAAADAKDQKERAKEDDLDVAS